MRKHAPAEAGDPRAGERIADLLAAEGKRNVLHVLICGAEGGGKTTLVARLTSDDEPRQGGALLRTLATPGRTLVLSEARGHESDTRDVVAGAASAAYAVLVVDAGQGLSTQARRHCCIAKLFEITRLALAVNKMDLIGFDRARFDAIAAELTAFAHDLGIEEVTAIPLSAAGGDAVEAPGARLDWYRGPTLRAHLETVEVDVNGETLPLRLAVQQSAEGDAASGKVLSGKLRPGDEVTVATSGARGRIARLVTADGATEAAAGDAVTLTLEGTAAPQPGDVLAAAERSASVSDQIAAHLIWTGAEPMLPGRVYALEAGGQKATATISDLKHKLSVDTLEHQAGKTLEADEVGYCNLGISRALVFDPFEENPRTGRFTLSDRDSGETVGYGLIAFGLRRATNIKWQALDVDRHARALAKGQRPCALWFTGLSGAGKSTVASLLEKRLHAQGRHTYVLDGDNVRHGLNKDLGFTDADRVENMRRIAETARLFTDAGLIVMVSFISPFRSERRMARELFEAGDFIEVFVDASMAVCEERDPKGLYKKARAGQIKNFTGIDSAYEPPDDAEIRLDAGRTTPEELVDQIMAELERRGVV